MTSDLPPQPIPQKAEGLYRPCVGLTLINQKGLVFIGERIDFPGSWQMPQGGIDDGEDLKTAFFREMREETGTDCAEILDVMPEKQRYNFPTHLRMRLYNGRYIGQEQTWVAARFLGEDCDICLNSHDPAEFRAWQWRYPMELLDLVVPWKRPTYEAAFRHFKQFF